MEQNKITDYVLGLLDEEAQLVFEAQMSLDETLREEVELAALLHAKARKQQKEGWKKEPQQGFRIQKLYKIAATFIGFVLMASLWFFLSKKDEDQYVASIHRYISNNQFPPPPGNRLGAAPNEETLWQEAINAYKSKKYLLCKEKLQQVPPTSEQLFYLGLCELFAEKGSYKNAILSFEDVISMREKYQQDAAFYLALSLIVDGRKEEGKKMLQMISEDRGHFYWEEARGLR